MQVMQCHYRCCNYLKEEVKVTKCHYGCCVYREPYPTYMVMNEHGNSTSGQDGIYVVNKRFRVPIIDVPRKPQVVDLKINQKPECRN